MNKQPSFALYGDSPNGGNNPTPTWPSLDDLEDEQPGSTATAALDGGDTASLPSMRPSAYVLLTEPNRNVARSYVTSATRMNSPQGKEMRSVTGFFQDVTGPGTDLVPRATDGTQLLPGIVLLSLFRRWSLIEEEDGSVASVDKWGELAPRPLTVPVFKETADLVAGTRFEASLIWALFYALGLRLLEMMTAAILMGQVPPTSRYAAAVLGYAAAGSIDKFKAKFRLVATFALTQVLISRDGEAPLPDTWDFTLDESQITSRRNPLCRWYWRQLKRLGSEFLLHYRFKMDLFAKDVLLEFPPLIDNSPATSVAKAKYYLTGAHKDLGIELRRHFDIPAKRFLQTAEVLENAGADVPLQLSLHLISSEALLNLAKALILIVGEDQAAFSLWERSPEQQLKADKRSYHFSHRIFVWPAVFLATHIKSLEVTSGYVGPNSYLIENNPTPPESESVFKEEEEFFKIFTSSINHAIKDPDFRRIIIKNTKALQLEANFGAIVTPLL